MGVKPKGWRNDRRVVLRKFSTHDNGGRPFHVHVREFDNRSHSGIAVVHKCRYVGDDDEVCDYGKLALPPISFKRIWIGRDKTLWGVYAGRRENMGNTVLFQVSATSYIHIGPVVYQFSVPEDDPIEEYASPVGNNDVPYPYAVSKKSVWCFEKFRLVRLPIGVANSRDPYNILYGQRGLAFTRYDVKFRVLHKRIS